jgi:hypothetical protein
MPTFELYCNNENTYWRIYKLIERLPSFFYIPYVCIDTPDVSIGDISDPNWAGFPMPIHEGDVYIFDDVIPALALGGAYHMRASIRVRDEDTDEVITLRIWHELLHAVGQPADDMVILATDWQTPAERILWYLFKLFNIPVDIPYWQRKYYTWLTKRAEGMV